MKQKLIAAVAVLTLGATIAVAGPGEGAKFDGKGGRGHGGELSARLARKLNLTQSQQEQIRTIKKESREQNAAFFTQLRQTRQELRTAKQANDTARFEALRGTLASQRAQMKQIRAAERQRILSVLTPEQRTQYEQLEAKRAERHAAKRGQKQQ